MDTYTMLGLLLGYCNTQAGYTLTGAGPCAGGSAYLGSVSECCDHCSGDRKPSIVLYYYTKCVICFLAACRGFDFDMRNGRCYCAAYWGGYQPHADIVAGNIVSFL